MEYCELISRHIRLARHLALGIYSKLGQAIELDELISSSLWGLYQAATRYNPDRQVAFATFARKRIIGAIYDGLRRHGALPRGRGRRRLLADPVGEQEALAPLALRTAEPDHGWQAASSPAADTLLAQQQRRRWLAQALQTLPPREHHFIQQCYFEGQTIAAAGAALGLSRSWSSRIHAQAMARLKAALAVIGIARYDDA
ncbi:MAG: hypothetical protein Tsb0020_10460 [Haliangiales bacterium]